MSPPVIQAEKHVWMLVEQGLQGQKCLDEVSGRPERPRLCIRGAPQVDAEVLTRIRIHVEACGMTLPRNSAGVAEICYFDADVILLAFEGHNFVHTLCGFAGLRSRSGRRHWMPSRRSSSE